MLLTSTKSNTVYTATSFMGLHYSVADLLEEIIRKTQTHQSYCKNLRNTRPLGLAEFTMYEYLVKIKNL